MLQHIGKALNRENNLHLNSFLSLHWLLPSAVHLRGCRNICKLLASIKRITKFLGLSGSLEAISQPPIHTGITSLLGLLLRLMALSLSWSWPLSLLKSSNCCWTVLCWTRSDCRELSLRPTRSCLLEQLKAWISSCFPWHIQRQRWKLSLVPSYKSHFPASSLLLLRRNGSSPLHLGCLREGASSFICNISLTFPWKWTHILLTQRRHQRPRVGPSESSPCLRKALCSELEVHMNIQGKQRRESQAKFMETSTVRHRTKHKYREHSTHFQHSTHLKLVKWECVNINFFSLACVW